MKTRICQTLILLVITLVILTGCQRPAEVPHSTSYRLPASMRWGEVVEGVRVGLQAEREISTANEVPAVKADFQITNPHKFNHFQPVPSKNVEFEVEGRWYSTRWHKVIRPTQQQDYFHIRFALYKDATHPLFLEPGNYTIRAAFTFQPKEVASIRPVCVISNPVRIKVLPYKELRAILSDMFKSRRPLALTDVQLLTVYNKQPNEFTQPVEVRLKRIVVPSPEAAREAWQRALDGEDFDTLISEYFVPWFASARSQPDAPGKHWVCTPWIPRSSLSTLENLPVGEISQPYHRSGHEEYFISKVVAERCLGLLPFQDVADKIYLRWCYELSHFTRRNWETDVPLLTMGTSPEKYALCLNLARRLLAEGEWAGAAGAALMAHRNRNPDLSVIRGKAIKRDEYPEEKILLDLGLNYVRYMRAIRRFYRLSDEKQKEMVPTLIREVETSQIADSIPWLGQIKDPRAIPVLDSCLTDDQIWVQERGGADQTTISLVYPVRMKALWALKGFGIEKQGIKTSVGQEIIIPTEPRRNVVK